jgi:serine/threonine protein kinase
MTDLRAQLQAGLGGTYTLERTRAILTVLDSGDAAGRLWFTIPFVEGESLRDRLRRERQLPVEDALRIAREAAQALQNAHGHGVIHRDIKPENLLLTDDGNTLVADFGIARTLGTGGQEKLTETGPVVGTPAYMSPEQAAGDKGLDARTDVYSLAAVLYEMLGGEPPFTGATTQAMLVEGDRRRAAAYGDSARGALEQQLYAAPDNNQLHALYGVALAYAGRKDAAIREGHRAVAPDSLLSQQGNYNRHQLARIYILTGEQDRALEVLESLLERWLRVDPTFDPLRNNPRFRRLVSSGSPPS